MMIRPGLTVALLICSIFLANGQTPVDIQEHIDHLIRHGDETQNQSYYETLLLYYQNPIDLNNTSKAELELLNLLSNDQIISLLKHIKATGSIQSIYELQAIPLFTVDLIRQIQPFITISEPMVLKKLFANTFTSHSNYAVVGYSRLLESKSGFIRRTFNGNADQAQVRIRFSNPGHLSIGITTQKDPGEPYFGIGFPPTPDYLSGHIFLQNQGRIKQLAIGDFKAQFGQGILLGSGFLIGKNVETVASVKQGSLGLLPYTSITEYNFFRGIGSTINILPTVDLTTFYSNKFIDATIKTDTTIEAVTAIRASGLHRTNSENLARKNLHEQVFGSILTYTSDHFSGGVAGLHATFDQPIIPTPRNYNQFFFNGENATSISIFSDASFNNITLFGELAKSIGAGTAWSTGMIASFSSLADFSILVRSFDKDFHSFYGLPFSERSDIKNERGIYWGIKLYPSTNWVVSAYYDMYSFPWLASNTLSPVTGNDFLVRIKHEISDYVGWFAQIRSEQTFRTGDAPGIPTNQQLRITKTAINMDYGKKKLTWRTRMQWNLAKQSGSSNGILAYQDANLSLNRYSLSTRLIYFDTDDFLSRQFAYEKDLLFTFNTQSFSGSGFRYYLLFVYKPVRSLGIRVKWSQTIYNDRSSIGQGVDKINGNIKSLISWQVKYNF